MGSLAPSVELEGIHCSMEIRRPAAGLVVVSISGTDIGELSEAPFRELEQDLEDDRPLALYIDARNTRGASIHVSNDWALWFTKHRSRLDSVTMLTGSRFIHITAEFVRRFSELDDLMRITTHPAAFDAALQEAISSAD